MYQKPVQINFLQFMMFFYSTNSLEKIIIKPIFSSKQRKISHLACIFGHLYLLKDILKQIDTYQSACVKFNGGKYEKIALQVTYQLLNSIDRDFSSPILLAMKNKRSSIV
jgi:hypothetical protein